MLEASEQLLASASASERGRAETFAAAYLAAEMEQDLIPADEARRLVGEHRAGATSDWRRSVFAALVGLRAVEA